MSGRNKPQIIRNCKKDINLAFLPNQIKESFVSLSQICYSMKKSEVCKRVRNYVVEGYYKKN